MLSPTERVTSSVAAMRRSLQARFLWNSTRALLFPRRMGTLTHLRGDALPSPTMVDVSASKVTNRAAEAEAIVAVPIDAWARLALQETEKVRRSGTPGMYPMACPPLYVVSDAACRLHDSLRCWRHGSKANVGANPHVPPSPPKPLRCDGAKGRQAASRMQDTFAL